MKQRWVGQITKREGRRKKGKEINIHTVKNTSSLYLQMWRVFHILTESVPYTSVSVN